MLKLFYLLWILNYSMLYRIINSGLENLFWRCFYQKPTLPLFTPKPIKLIFRKKQSMPVFFQFLCLFGSILFSPGFINTGFSNSKQTLDENKPTELTDTTQSDPVFNSALFAYHHKKYEQAYHTIHGLAQQGHAKGQTLLAYFYEKGIYVQKDDDQATYWYKKAAKKNNTDAYIGLARLALDQRAGLTLKDVKSYLTKAASLNNNSARRILSELYKEGKSVKSSPQLSAYWLAEAANHKDVEAQELLARFYLNGFGVPKSIRKALKWFERAAKNGSSNALYALALLYLKGKATDFYIFSPNPEEGINYLKQAANLNHPAAMADLGLMFYQGKHIEHSPKKALYWIKKAAHLEDVEGCYLYALLLAKGEEKEQKDFDQAYYWLLKSEQTQNKEHDLDQIKLKKILETTLNLKRKTEIKYMISEHMPYTKTIK